MGASRSSSSSSSSRSSIHIKKSHEGLFTAKAKAAGKSVQEEAASVLKPGSKASAKTKKQANFARNAAKWKK
ncbi:MAG: hypothetical protein ABSH41_03900 [Syntrophobacteraceae bacterium]|jgi:hypothetical protein